MYKEIVDFTSDLIRIPTVNPPGENYPEICELLAKKMDEAGLEVEMVKVPKQKLKELNLELPRINVIGTFKGSLSKPVFHLSGHYDVVPAGEGWTVEPFNPRFVDGRLYGRGSSDMKGALAAMVIAVKAIKDSGVDLKGSLVVSVTPDEETGGLTGVGYLVENNLLKGDGAILGEPSGIEKICVAHKGTLWMKIATLGKAAHASIPHLGVNSVEKAAKIIVELQKLKEKFKHRITNVPMEEISKTPTINIGGVIQGGIKINIVPDRCSFTLDRRFIPEETLEEVEKEILTTIESLKKEDPELKVETEILLRAEAAYTSPNEKVCLFLKESIKEVLGKLPTVTGLTGVTDMRFLNKVMPTVIYGPGTMEKAHTPDEYVVVDHLVASAKVYALTALKFLT